MTAAIGGSTLSAGLADAQAQLQAAVAPNGTSADVAQLAAAYRQSGGGPILAWLGFNPFEVMGSGAFHTLYWSGIVIFLGVAAIISMQQSLMGRQTSRARHPLAALAQANFRLLAGALLVANLPLVYGLLVTVNGAVTAGVQAIGAGTTTSLLQTGSMATLTFAAARSDAIRRAAARRAAALYPSGATRAEMTAFAQWYDALAQAINSRGPAAPLPILGASEGSAAQSPDDRVIAALGRSLLQDFGPLVAALAALPAESDPLAVDFPAGAGSSLQPLSAALAQDDAQAAAAIAMANLPSNDGAFESARASYAQAVLTDTLAYLDGQVLPLIGASPTLADRAKGWFSSQVERAAAAAGGLFADLRDAVDWAGRAVGVVLTRSVAFIFTLAVRVLMELELFILALAVPFWILPATENAFYGVLRSLLGLAVLVPAYQFIMLFVDALMGLVLRYILLGPAAAGSGGSADAAAGGAYATGVALITAASGGEILALATFCYLASYLFLAVYVAFKTPRLVALFLKGSGAAGAFVTAFATGLMAGAATALATAAVGGRGGLAASLLGESGGGRAPPAPPPLPGAASAPAGPRAGAIRPRYTRLATTARGRSRGEGSEAGEACRFGLRTFLDNLSADSPAEALRIARQAWERHEKLRSREDGARVKAEARAQKEAAKAGRHSAEPD